MTRWQQIDRMRGIYIARCTEQVKRALLKQIEPVLEMMKTRPINQVEVNMDQAPIKEAFEKLYTQVGIGFSKDAYSRLGGKRRKSDIEDIWETEMSTYVRTRLGARIVSITGTSKEIAQRIMKQIVEETIIPEGIGIEEASRMFQREFRQSYLQTSLARARVIAQTEILTASNYGSQMGAQGAGAKYKVWQTSGIVDPEGKERHVAYPGLHDQRREMNEPYDVGGSPAQYPGDPSLPVGDVVNCKCAEVYE